MLNNPTLPDESGEVKQKRKIVKQNKSGLRKGKTISISRGVDQNKDENEIAQSKKRLNPKSKGSHKKLTVDNSQNLNIKEQMDDSLINNEQKSFDKTSPLSAHPKTP